MGDIDHHRFVHAAGVVTPVEGEVFQLVPSAIGEMCIAPGEVAGEPFAIGIDQQLVWIEAMSGVRFVRAVHAVAVKLAGRYVGKINVPNIFGTLRHGNPLGFPPALAFEQAELDLGRVRGK
jgi:hypothetical protein